MTNTPPPPVVHQPAQARFVLAQDALLCELNYRIAAKVLHLVRTYVPTALEGRGYAAQLVAAAVQYARATGLLIAPDCSYVQAWLQRHPEHRDLVAAPSSSA